ncbi:MAG: hypothetical protein WKG00_32475 [Polyangiaceae bacterium]
MASRSLAPLLLGLVLTACSTTPTSTPPDALPPETKPDAGSPAPPSGGSRPSLTAEECAARGGTVVGDIGDGATHRPDYVCQSGGAPLGNVKPPAGGPVAIEGSVCCPK